MQTFQVSSEEVPLAYEKKLAQTIYRTRAKTSINLDNQKKRIATEKKVQTEQRQRLCENIPNQAENLDEKSSISPRISDDE